MGRQGKTITNNNSSGVCVKKNDVYVAYMTAIEAT